MEKYDIILVNPGFINVYRTTFPPFGSMFLSHSLKKAGFKVKIFDEQFNNMNDFCQLIKKHQPLWVGFAVMTGPSITNSLKLSKKIREINPDINIVWGGPHPTLLPKNTLKHKLIDIIVIGEAERTVVDLTKALKSDNNLDNVSGIGYKTKDGLVLTTPREYITNWDDEVGLDWDSVNIKRFIDPQFGGKYNKLSFITSRGCPFRCSFCWNLEANNKKWRGWSAKKIIEEIKRLIPYGVNYIVLEDDNFGVDIARAKEVISFMKKHDILWSFEGLRVGKHITPELVKFFKENNCHHVSFGAECGTQRMLDYIKKDITIEQLIDSARITGDYGLGIRYSWIVGFPKETHKDRMKLVDLIDKINKLNPNSAHYIGIFGPFPGSPLYQETIKAGWKPPKTLDGWALFREEYNLPYCKNMWYLRSISLTCFFRFAIDSPLRAHSKTKIIYKLPFEILKFTSRVRWKYKLFGFPIEYIVLTKAKELYHKFQKIF